MATALTPLGEVKGTDLNGCERYAGIRYAEPPIAERRFRGPVAVSAWEGVYDATDFGASSPQMKEGVARALTGNERMDEDCLFLNVYTPRADDRRRPVLVWIHGGAYVIGSGDIYDGSDFCRAGDVVVVTLNYRLGALGWLPLDHLDASYAGSGNNGVRDQIQALRWVNENIAAFGGDPDRVTIFGESAGGGSVFAVLAAPDADGLYHRAIVQSGCPGFDSIDYVPRFVEQFVDALGTRSSEGGGTLDAVLEATPAELIAANQALGALARLGTHPDYPLGGMGLGFHPIVDGVVLKQTVAARMASLGSRNVPLLAGTNRDEGTLFDAVLPDLDDASVAASIAGMTPRAEEVVARYRARNTGRKLSVDLFTESAFHIPSQRVVDAAVAGGAESYVYLFDWRTPIYGGALGATHALDVPFVWSALDDPRWVELFGDAAPRRLATQMRDAWIAFAKGATPAADGLPDWPRYDLASRPTLVLDEKPYVDSDPDGDLRALWEPSEP